MASVWIEARKKGRERTYLVRWVGHGSQERGGQVCYSKPEAVQLRDDMRRKLSRARLGLEAMPSSETAKRTLAEFVKQYMAYSRSHKAASTAENFDARALDMLKKMLGNDIPFANIAPNDIEAWKLAMLQKFNPNTVRLRLRSVKAAFAYAERLGFCSNNPAKIVRMPPAVAVGRVLTPKEIKAILAGVTAHALRDAIVLTLYTGLRRGELLALDWSWVKTPRQRLEIHIPAASTKTRTARVVPIHPAVQGCLGRPASGRIFPYAPEYFQHGLAKAAAAAKLGRVRWHDLRHTWATKFMETTGDMFSLMQMGGWRSIQSVTQYQHLTRGRRDAILGLNYGSLPTGLPLNGFHVKTQDDKKRRKIR